MLEVKDEILAGAARERVDGEKYQFLGRCAFSGIKCLPTGEPAIEEVEDQCASEFYRENQALCASILRISLKSQRQRIPTRVAVRKTWRRTDFICRSSSRFAVREASFTNVGDTFSAEASGSLPFRELFERRRNSVGRTERLSLEKTTNTR